jgi:hypothetical protein
MKLQVRTLTRQRTTAVIPRQRRAAIAPVEAPAAAPPAPAVPGVEPVVPAAPSVTAAVPVEQPAQRRWHFRHSWELTSGRDGFHPRKVCTTCGKDVGLGAPREADRWSSPERSLHGYRL